MKMLRLFSLCLLILTSFIFSCTTTAPVVTDTTTIVKEPHFDPMPPPPPIAVASPLIPMDDRVRTGQLANGLKYFIQKNGKPENRAELRLAINAGSMQEDDDQLGLAHFVEHMAFNGSKNFKKNELVDYLESVGTRFGPDLNAYTSFDETVYMLQVRTDDQEKMLKGLLVLEDGHL